jgi:glycerate 2-kinase
VRNIQVEVLIIPDSFKGSLSAKEVAIVMEQSVQSIFPKSNSLSIPFSDGGEGALSVLQFHKKGKLIKCSVTDALKKPIEAQYLQFNDQKSAWIELSQTAGLTQLDHKKLNPLQTSTWGTGKMITHVLDQGCTKIYLGIGGSATQDLGTGIISALGGRFLDDEGQELQAIGGELYRLNEIDLSGLNPKVLECEWIIACDVQNPLLGENGSAHTYAKQKGASPKDIDQLEKGAIRFAEVIEKQFGLDIRSLKGGGAAGGVSAGLHALLGARLENGFDLLAQKTELENKIQKMDLILTGEGSFDEQSLFGKLPIKVASLAEKEKIPTLIVVGKAKLKKLIGFPHCKVIDCTPPGVTTKDAIINARYNLEYALRKELLILKNHNL